MAAVNELKYRIFDELLDSVRLDLPSFQSQGDIDASTLIKIAQKINYELGLRIYQQKETMLEIEHHRAKLPADYHQCLLTLICHQWRHVQNSPWNGNVLLEQVVPTTVQPSTCPCWTCTSTGYQTNVTDCYGITTSTYFPPNSLGGPLVTTICAKSIDTTGGHGSGSLTATTASFCYNNNVNGVYTCAAPSTCDICNITHVGGTCPELVINPYPLGKTRTICNNDINIKILSYCSTEVRCYEQFERLYIEPHITADAFSTQGQFRSERNRASISDGFLYTEGVECGKVYMYYTGSMEDEDGNLLVLDHPKVNSYYRWALVEHVLENLWLNGEGDLSQRVKYAHDKKEEYKMDALSIANMPSFREVLKTAQVIRDNYKRQHYFPLSRWKGYLGWANSIDDFTQPV